MCLFFFSCCSVDCVGSKRGIRHPLGDSLFSLEFHFVSTFRFHLFAVCFVPKTLYPFGLPPILFDLVSPQSFFLLLSIHSSAFQRFVASFSLSTPSLTSFHRSQSSLFVTPSLDPFPTVSFKFCFNWHAFRWTFRSIIQRIILLLGSSGRRGVKRSFRIICRQSRSFIAKWFCRFSARFWLGDRVFFDVAMLERDFAERNECFCQSDWVDERIECELSRWNAIQYDPRMASFRSHPVFHVSLFFRLEFIWVRVFQIFPLLFPPFSSIRFLF